MRPRRRSILLLRRAARSCNVPIGSLSGRMGKIHVNHRLVTRNSAGKIIKDEQFESFATGGPAFRIAADTPSGWGRQPTTGVRHRCRSRRKMYRDKKTVCVEVFSQIGVAHGTEMRTEPFTIH
jgi:hypothetical protein